MHEKDLDRREFLKSAAISSAVLVGAVPVICQAAGRKKAAATGVEEVGPVEDLMREHGALDRILLVYEEGIRRIQGKEQLDPALLKEAAVTVRDFIEKYHEKLEEEHLFPRLSKAHRLSETVDTLLAQHKAGRKLTAGIIERCSAPHFHNPTDLSELSSAMRLFIRMYRPHAAREDTIVFPAFKKLVTPKEYQHLGDQFEDLEHKLFGKEGFEGVVGRIADIEKALGIFDLSSFTPARG